MVWHVTLSEKQGHHFVYWVRSRDGQVGGQTHISDAHLDAWIAGRKTEGDLVVPLK